MGLDAQMLLGLDEPLTKAEIDRLNHDLVRSICTPFGISGYTDQINAQPIKLVCPEDAVIDPRSRIPEDSRDGVWYWVGLQGRYYGIKHEQGDILGFVSVAEWLEHRLSSARLWYGSDAHDQLERFDEPYRRKLKLHFYTVGHAQFANP